LIPVVDRLGKRFRITRVCVVADRGMISAATIVALEARGLEVHPRRARADEQRGAHPGPGRRRRDPDRLQEVEVEQDGKRFILRTPVMGCAGKLFQILGIALPPDIRDAALDPADPVADASKL
jgi:hypothetical protein